MEQPCFLHFTSAVLCSLEIIDLRFIFLLCKNLIITYYSYYNLCSLAIILLSQGGGWYELTLMVGVESRWGVVERNYSFPERQNIAESRGNVCVEKNTTGVGDGKHRGAEHISSHSNRWRWLFSSCDALLMLTRSCPSLTAKLPVKDDTDGCSKLKLLADFSLPLVYCFH